MYSGSEEFLELIKSALLAALEGYCFERLKLTELLVA
jgi:hypothetical protein